MIDKLKASVLSEAQFREEVRDKLSVVFHGCNMSPLARSLHRKQCEDFLVARYAEARQASAWQPIDTYTHPDGISTGHQVLIATEGDLVGEAYLNPKTGQWWWSGTMEGEYADSPIHSKVTHFQRLPLAPPVLEDDAHGR